MEEETRNGSCMKKESRGSRTIGAMLVNHQLGWSSVVEESPTRDSSRWNGVEPELDHQLLTLASGTLSLVENRLVRGRVVCKISR